MKLSPIRVLFLVGASLVIVSMIVWPKQIIPGSNTQAQTKSKQALDDARARLEQATAYEKFNSTKQSALATDEALKRYNAAVDVRVSEIRDRLKELYRLAGKNKITWMEIEALEAELSSLQPAAGPAPDATPETESNNTPGTANLLNLASAPCAIISAAINPDGDVDYFTFTAPAGSNIWIEADTGGTQDAAATSRDTVIDLLAADGMTVIESDDDDGTGNGGDGTIEATVASLIGGRALTAGGTYFIRVRAFGSSAAATNGAEPIIINPYRLFVVLTNTAANAEVESNDTAATANSIVTQSGQIGLRSGSISPAGDADYYSFAATAGNIVYFNADADPERDGSGPDLVVEFRDPADVLLLTIDSSITGSLGNPAAEGANFTIATSGTYFIRVRHLGSGGVGTYRLMVSTCSGALDNDCLIVCPANITVPNDPNQLGAVVNYPAPTTNGNCGIVTCSPPSGSFFPIGTTTVTCATTAGPSCTFMVSVSVSNFDARLQDDSAGCDNTVLFNTITGEYRWCCNGTTFTGVATVKQSGDTFNLQHNAPDRRVLIKLSAGSSPPSGTGSIQSPSGTNRCTIQDRDTRNDTCLCIGGDQSTGLQK
ncbi:MAG TPA: pre-peptidase C-terminal domain-containing protein [Blastocatellia bacterium]|nr:pre-peptidase C-terminal domain-containing protein [Blastocatellia bacterium]